ncbi:MAG: ABC transporter substrate-binding protein [bacterium]
MEKKDHISGLNRRDFLKAACFMTGGLIISPPSFSFFSPCNPAIKIGILVPGSKIYPDLGHNLLAGMKAYFEHSGKMPDSLRVELNTKDIGCISSAALRNARLLIEDDHVDIVAAYINTRAAGLLKGLFHEKKIPLVVANTGENLIKREAGSPYIFHISLNHWQAEWALGRWAARNMGKRGVMAASFYDSGYDALYAFRLGFEQAGGEILKTWVTGSPVSQDVTLTKILIEAKRLRPDFIHASYCGRKAVKMVKAYADSRISGKIPLIGSGFFVDDGILPELGEAALGIKSCLSWSGGLGTDENRSFISAFRATTGKRADAFAVLGYDTARLIGEAVKAAGGATSKEVLRDALSSLRFFGPRGAIAMNPGIRCMTAPLYIREVRQSGGRLSNMVIHKPDPVSEGDKSIRGMRDSLTSGWTNFYMAV